MIEFSACLSGFFQTLLLLLAANGAPILTAKWLGNLWSWPIDNDYTLSDGRRLLGHSKTWRGLLSSVAATTLIALLCGLNLILGALFGLLVMLSDCCSSFIKRRFGYAASSRARGIDTIPESLFAPLLLMQPLGLNLTSILLLVLVFFLMEEFVSPLLYQWHIRKRPY